jgi:hypothetical protein
MQDLILSAVLRGVPYLIVIVSAAVFAVRRKSIIGALMAAGCAAIAIQPVWSIFAPAYLRTHTPAEYGTIILPMSVCSLAGWYVLSVTIAVLLLQKGNKSGNQASQASESAPGEDSPAHKG